MVSSGDATAAPSLHRVRLDEISNKDLSAASWVPFQRALPKKLSREDVEKKVKTNRALLKGSEGWFAALQARREEKIRQLKDQKDTALAQANIGRALHSKRSENKKSKVEKLMEKLDCDIAALAATELVVVYPEYCLPPEEVDEERKLLRALAEAKALAAKAAAALQASMSTGGAEGDSGDAGLEGTPIGLLCLLCNGVGHTRATCPRNVATGAEASAGSTRAESSRGSGAEVAPVSPVEPVSASPKDDCRVMIIGLEAEVTAERLATEFSRFGQVINTAVFPKRNKDPNNPKKWQFGFVTFTTRNAMLAALHAEVVIAGNKVTIRLPDVHPSQRNRPEIGSAGRVSNGGLGSPSDGDGTPRVSTHGGFGDSSLPRSSSSLSTESVATRGRDFGAGSQSVVISVPNAAISWIIGKRGSRITEIQNSSGARVQVSADHAGPERTITLIGTDATIAAAKKEIADVVTQFTFCTAGRSVDNVGNIGNSVTSQHRPHRIDDVAPPTAMPRLGPMGAHSDMNAGLAFLEPSPTHAQSSINPSVLSSIRSTHKDDVERLQVPL
jgi:hypothetical protein